MSLPDAPNTLREKYYSVMAGQNDADILPDIETAPSTENRYLDYIARNGGGGGGDVTKEYVDTAIATAVAVKVDKVEGKGLSTNDYTNADKAIVQDSPISSTSTVSPLTDSADGYVQGVTVKGHSEVVDGAIKSIGDAGWGVVDLGTLTWTYNSEIQAFNSEISNIKINSNNDIIALCAVYSSVASYTELIATNKTTWINNTQHKIVIRDTSYTDAATFKAAMSGVLLCYQEATPTNNTIAVKTDNGSGINGTMATFTTALPLRSTLDGTTRDELIIGNGKAEVITRCEVVDDDIVPLATPTVTPLTDAEISAFRGLSTYDGTTNITITDEPEYEIDYLKNTGNGQAVADIQKDLQGQIDSGGSGMTETTLYDVWSVFAVNDMITLSDDADKYDALIIYTSYHETSNTDYYTHYGRCIIPKNDILRSIAETPEGKPYSGFVDAPASTSNSSYSMVWVFNMPDKKTLVSKGKTTGSWSQNQCGVYKIVGVNY